MFAIIPAGRVDMKALIFDLDDTLIVEEAFARDSLAAALSFGGVTVGQDTVDVALTCARRLWRTSVLHDVCLRLGIASWEGLWATFEGCHACLAGLADWASEYRQAAWSDALDALGADRVLAPLVSDRFIELQRSGHPVISSAVAAVRSVHGAATAVLMNGPSDIQRLKLVQANLENSFDVVVISGEVGVGKPDPAVFCLALEMLEVEAADAVMIGDSWERDVLGARQVGMDAVWVSCGRASPERLEGVTVVDRLSPSTLTAL